MSMFDKLGARVPDWFVMMKIAATICCLLLLLLLAPACATKSVEPKPEILGVRLGMSREEAHAHLRNIGGLEKQERRQQEVWRLNGDPAYTHLMVAYNKEYTAVRYITAVANEGGGASVTRMSSTSAARAPRAFRRAAPPRRRCPRATTGRPSSPKPSAMILPI